MAEEPNWNLNILDIEDNSKCWFTDVSGDDVDKHIGQQENENTKKNTMYDLKMVLKLLREVRKEERELEKIPPEELNVQLYLSDFIIFISRLLSEKSYQALTVILQGTNIGKGFFWFRVYEIERRIEIKGKRTEKTKPRK